MKECEPGLALGTLPRPAPREYRARAPRGDDRRPVRARLAGRVERHVLQPFIPEPQM